MFYDIEPFEHFDIGLKVCDLDLTCLRSKSMWSSAKSLRCIVSDVVCNGKADRLLEMESSFKKHRQLLLSPLSFPEKCESDYESVKNAHSSAVMLPDFPHRVQLSEDVVHESLFLSEVFKLNELLAVELCLTVESQLSFFPRLTRGLVGVLLYYESHLSIIDALATLIAARDGRMWPSSTTAEICQTLHAITDDLFASGLLQNILGALQAFSAHAEFSRLENLQVLGDSKHRHDVFMLLKNISEGLSECVMLWSCQNALNLNEFKLVLDCLLSSKPQNSSTRTDSSQSQLTFQSNDQLSREGLHLLMSLLHCLQPFSSSTPCADQVSDLTDYDWIHPLYTDHSFASGIGRLLDYRKSVCENHSNETDSHQLKLLGLIRLSWALCLRKTSHLRAELRRRQNVDVSRSAPNTGVSENVLTSISEKDFGIGGDEEDELQAASAIESGALEFARKNVLNTPNFERETLWVYCMHCIITDLIVHMTARVKEIRLRDEDLLRSTGFDPSTTGHGFANFLLLIAQLYNQPGSRLHGRLALEYWWPVGELVNITPVALGSGDLLSSSVTNKSPRRKFSLYGTRSRNAELDNIRQAALMRFLRLAGDMVTTPCLFLPYLRVLHGLCCSRSAAGLCFSLLKANATNPGRGASLITWDHFFNSFRQYLNHMKQVVMQSEPVNLRLQASNQLYPHIYYSDGAASRPRGSGCPRSATESMYVGKKGVGATDLSTTAPVITQPRSIQPEEQAGLQAVLRLVARICRMDPVARSAFISNPQWQVVPMCMGFLTCPVSLDLKADVLYLLTELGKSQQNVPLLWQHFVSAELLPFTIIRSGGQPQSTNGLNTDMDEVEPRAEEYPLTNAFLTLMTVMLPKLINYPIASNSLKSSDGKEISSYGLSGGGNVMQANPFVSITSFITNTIFLRHTMRAYRNPVERWDIAASCLVLFDGLVNDFLNRLNNATVMITTLMTSNHEKDVDNLDSLFASSSTPVSDVNCGKIQQSVDWPSCLLSILFQMGKEQQIHGRHLYSTTTTPTTTATSEVLINQLHLPAGWPYSDPGYHLAAQLLTDSSLFRMVTGLLEVGLHRHLEFPIPNGPPAGMTRATYAGLSLIRRLLASEDILVTFVRRIATNVQPRMGSAQTAISNISVPLPNLPSFGLTVLPVYVSRLLMSTNSGSGRADLIPMLLKYCMLADYLPDHTSCAVSILGYLAASIKPHSDLLALLTVDEATRSQLLGAFAYLIKWPVSTLSNSTTLNPTDSQCVTYNLDNEGYFAFTDEWLHGDNYDDRGLCLRTTGTFSARLPPPASYAARVDAAFPSQTTSWYFPNLTWERWASYVNTYFSTWSDIRITHNRIMINSDYYTTAFGDWFYQVTTDSNTVPISVSFLQILLAVMDHPTPNLAHWLCGFRFDSCKAISRSNLQDAGISDQQRTCLHSMLDLIDTTSHWLQSASTLPFEFACTLHWNSALIWQILYRLGSNPLTSEPLLRFLRSNHDLLAKYLHLDVCHSPFSSSVIGNICESFTARQKAVVEALSLNRKNWILRLYAIEIRVSAIANQRSYVTRLLKLFLGDLLFDNSLVPSVNESRESPSVLVSFIQLLNASEEFISKSNPLESKMFDSSLIHEVMAKSEVACSLLTSDSNAARSLSTMIHFKIFLMSLYIKLVGLRSDMDTYTHEDLNRLLTLTFEQVFDVSISAHDLSSLELFNAASSSTSVSTLIKQISAVREWIDTRNIHGLQLYVGKQAAIEAWRQAVEISLGLLTNQPYYGNKVQKSSQLVPCVSSYLHSELISVIRDGGLNDSIECKPQLRPVPVLCMDVLVLLLSQICAIKEVPQTIRLLASGTCLTLCSFLHCQSNIISMKSNVSESGGVNKCTYHKHWSSLLVSLMGLLIRSIVRTKTSTQRMRANYYGSLCYVIRFCRNLGQSLKEDKMASSDFKSLSECFSVFTSSSVSGFDTNHSGSVDPSDLNQLHSMLITDLIHGHTVTQMAAMSLLELLVSFDRCSQQLISHLDTQGTIQHILDTVMEDLNTISKFLTSIDTGMLDDSSAAHNNRRSHLPVDPIGSCISTAVSAFLLYQSKMSLLCRIGSYPVGAKILSTHGILNRLANCELFSLSNLASCYSYGLDSLYICEDINQQVNYPNNSDECNQTDLTWFRSSKYLRSFPFSAAVKSDNCVYWDLLELVITGSVECSRLTADEEDEMKVTWAATLIPTLRLCKIVLNSLGPTHMSINQQVFNFVYTHSSSLMCNETQLTSSIVTFLSRQDWSYVNHNPGSSCQINSDWLIQWIASETNIISLFSLIMQACNSSLSISCTDEYSNLQREIIQSKILRHVFELLGNLINPNVSPCDELSRRSQFQSSCLAFEYFFIETQHIQLLCSLLFILTAYLSNPENRIRKFNSDGVNKWSTRSLFQFFSSHTITSEQENSVMNTKVQDTLILFVNLLKWALKCLRSKEKICLALVDAQFLSSRSQNKNEHQQQFGQSVAQLLNCELANENPSLGQLKQASSIILKCPIQLLNSNDRTVSRDNQNSEILVMQRLTQIGVSCLRVQLCGLIGIIEQSTFLLWKHLTNFINNPDIMLENIKAGTRDQCVQPQRIRDLSFSNNNTTSPFKSPKLSSLTPTKLSAGFTVVGQEDKSLIQKNISLVRSHFEYLMQDDMFEILDQLTQAAYLKPNQRLFIQVMHSRLERILGKTNNTSHT